MSTEPTSFPLSRRRLLAATALSAASLMLPRIAVAQDNQIISTQRGDVPTTGGLRPGPMGAEPPQSVTPRGVEPVAIRIPDASVQASVEQIEIVDGVMQDPTGPWVVSWYKETAGLGEVGNVVMSGHLDYWDVGPAVFYYVGQLVEGSVIEVTGADEHVYEYEVEYVVNYDADNAPIQDIVGKTPNESLTLITCGGPFDYTNGVYLQRTVVRSHRV